MKDAPATKADIQRLEGGINNLDARTQRLEGSIEKINVRFQRLEVDMENIDARFHRVEDSIQNLDDRTQRSILNLDARTERLAVEIVRTHERMGTLEDGLKHEMRQLNSQVLGALDAAAGRMETLWRESAIIPRVLDELGAMLRAHDARLGRLEAR